ncbi:hypothetical protein P170DRAFT_322936, partial [Aspergillus steynii IBT 23096]
TVEADLVPGDEVIARGYERNYNNLEAHGFRPIWAGTYPHPEIPADILEHLDEDGGGRGAAFIGPLRSFAWLAGLDELVDEIDSRAYVIEDEIIEMPRSAEFMWAIVPFIELKIVSFRTVEKVYGARPRYLRESGILPKTSPAGVTNNPSPFPLAEITPNNRLQRPSGKIMCMRLKSVKDRRTLEINIRRLAEGHLASRNLWFRGLSISALESTLTFFIPQANESYRDNEFGPGIYVADSLSESLRYATRGAGAIMVFKDPDLHNSNVWRLSDDEWNAWTFRWTSPNVTANRAAPAEYTTADFVQGALSERYEDLGAARQRPRTQSQDTQLVAVSYKGCQILSDSLHMIIF